jgi:hypothetical protein
MGVAMPVIVGMIVGVAIVLAMVVVPMVMIVVMVTMIVLLHGLHLTSVAQISIFGAAQGRIWVRTGGLPRGNGTQTVAYFR